MNTKSLQSEMKRSLLEEILVPFINMDTNVAPVNTAEMLDDLHELQFVLTQHPEYSDWGLQQSLSTVNRFYKFLRMPIVKQTLDKMLKNAI